jgi:hypothetical protein
VLNNITATLSQLALVEVVRLSRGMSSFRLPVVLCLFSALIIAGCGRHDHHHAQHQHGHVHAAPHGGTLVELGDHQFNLEFLHDRDAGRLTVFVLDGHAEHAVRIAQTEIELLIDRNAQTESLVLRAVANQLSNETVGNTSEFTVQADWLRDAVMIAGRVNQVTVRGTTFSLIHFVLW